MRGNMEALGEKDYTELKQWVNANDSSWPGPKKQALRQLFSNYDLLLNEKKQSLINLKLLRQAMGIIPKSERGGQLEKHEIAI
jgi:hypothetical protein